MQLFKSSVRFLPLFFKCLYFIQHASIESTLRYAKHATQKKLEVMDQLAQMGDKSPAKVPPLDDIKIIKSS